VHVNDVSVNTAPVRRALPTPSALPGRWLRPTAASNAFNQEFGKEISYKPKRLSAKATKSPESRKQSSRRRAHEDRERQTQSRERRHYPQPEEHRLPQCRRS
jgi:hypothetical protein